MTKRDKPAMSEEEFEKAIKELAQKEFATGNRVSFFNNIKNNDYDCVIMSHDQFGKI